MDRDDEEEAALVGLLRKGKGGKKRREGGERKGEEGGTRREGKYTKNDQNFNREDRTCVSFNCEKRSKLITN